ncbi:hypothetical protein ABID56_001399 [Alkalibacillus flavidus]|uniref:Uncharacterized protein n=1 Tax=Alkalibacillus flavidus TaxID=546021 RepID=A0ABV2KVD6_9BACI
MCSGSGGYFVYEGAGVYRVVSCQCEKTKVKEPLDTVFARWDAYIKREARRLNAVT